MTSAAIAASIAAEARRIADSMAVWPRLRPDQQYDVGYSVDVQIQRMVEHWGVFLLKLDEEWKRRKACL